MSKELEEKQGEWYVIHTYSGHEKKVKANLEKRVESMGMEDKIYEVVIPMEEKIEIKDGERQIKEKKVFPGYVLVNMEITDDSWHVVRNTPAVTGFVGMGSQPTPLQDHEMERILAQMGMGKPTPEVEFDVGDNVKVRSGPFEGFVGEVDEINLDKGKVRVLVSMFGRETPVELDFSEVEML